MKIGYRRVSTVEQKFDRQDLGADIERVFEEKESGGTAERKALQEMIAFARSGDEVIVYSIDRLARNLRDLQQIIEELNNKEVTVTFLSERLSFNADSSDAFAKLQLQMLGAFSEYERNIIRKRQAEGIEKAKANGVYTKTKKINPDKIRQLRSEGIGATEICRRLSCSRTSVYNALSNSFLILR